MATLGEHTLSNPVVTLSAGLLLGDLPFESAVRAGALRFRTWHIPGSGRLLAGDGLIDYLPLRASDVIACIRPGDVALVRCTPPDRHGRCSLGPSASYGSHLVHTAGLVVAEVDPDLPWTHGDTVIPASRVDRFVASAQPTLEYSRERSDDPRLKTIAARVCEVVPTGATVQLGIGAVSEAVSQQLAPLAEEKQLGLLGLITDATWPLVEAVCRSGRGPVLAIEIMGSSALMAAVHRHPGIEMLSSQRGHDPVTIGRLPKLISINSALAVSLTGHVYADTVGGRLIAGVGGSVDFFEGAHMSAGGLRVIALTSTDRRGNSTILDDATVDGGVTIPHHSVDMVVTEHGVAPLTGRSLRERRQALIGVAAPEHRERLSASPVGLPRAGGTRP
ncbi:acetyl-CoA hydrolase/transferase C-terminal domain-containing protein [Nocardioides sp. S5]|uniref:acetyl-CoA hydrolase/transferase family protein n=1 Tax=Nocardioides sp. S5 TaxID=2017486 RepID=UPI001A904771|nr:acetyl-CoA hydrolase/transferase C-terminal domain-containing protein [Nocardioides sp. S5]